MPHRNNGFTLIELLIAIAILAILMALVIPSLAAAKAATATHTLRQALIAGLVDVRSRAAASEQVVLFCPSFDQVHCAATEEWQRGFLAAIDHNNNGEVDADDTLILSRGMFDRDTRAVTTSGRRKLKFYPNGGNAGSNATFTFCDRRGPTKAVSIAMSNAGNYREVPITSANLARACLGFD